MLQLLALLTEQQHQFDVELNKIQLERETERFRLIEQLQEGNNFILNIETIIIDEVFFLAENSAYIAIKQLLALNQEPLAQLLEQEKQEEERLMIAVNRYNETVRNDDVLAAMQNILEQEAEKFKQFDQSRIETTQTILER